MPKTRHEVPLPVLTSVALDSFRPDYRFIEITAAASHVGKSMLAAYLAALLRLYGFRVTLIRIESKAASAGDADIAIASEGFSQAARLAGGEVAIAKPVFDALEAASNDGGIVILDWGGGLADYRIRIHAATRMDDRLGEYGIRGLSLVVTTALIDRMRQAAESVSQTRLVIPDVDCAVVLNARAGGFAFVAGTEECAAFDALQKAADGLPIIRIPSVTGETWKACSAAGLSMQDVIKAKVRDLAQRMRVDTCTASAFQMQIEAWWTDAENEFLPLLGGAVADRAG